MTPDEYLTHDATALAALVADGRGHGPRAAGPGARSGATQVNPAINAVVMDLERRRRRPRGRPRRSSGPFAGVPFLIKDLGQEYAGFPTSNGSRALADDVADRHALVTQRFLDAGLVVFGKTNTPEFGAKGITESELWGPARNPWNTAHTPGRLVRRLGRRGRGRASCRRPGPTTAAARSASPRPATGSSASRPAAASAPTVRRPAR